MLKKLIIVAFIMFVANQAYCQEMRELTPLQKRVRAIFSEIRNKDKIETVKETEETADEQAVLEVTEEKTTF